MNIYLSEEIEKGKSHHWDRKVTECIRVSMGIGAEIIGSSSSDDYDDESNVDCITN